MTATSQIIAAINANTTGVFDIITFPLSSTLPWYSFDTVLSQVSYTLRFRYNVRSQRWMMDLADAGDNDIICGVTMLINTNLFGQFVEDALPPGCFFVLDNTGSGNQPTLNSFGLTHTLYYYDPTTTTSSGST